MGLKKLNNKNGEQRLILCIALEMYYVDTIY